MKPSPAQTAGSAACLLAAGRGAVAAAPVKTQHVEAELVSERTALVPGQATTVALRLKMADGWHTYWQNPGDCGPADDDRLDAAAGRGRRPDPVAGAARVARRPARQLRLRRRGAAARPTSRCRAGAQPGETLTLAAKAEWLVCRETCIPEEAALDLELPVAERADPYPQWGKAIAATRDALPRTVPGWLADARGDGQKVVVTLTGARRRRHARRRALLPVSGRPHRALRQADVRARAERHVRADAAGGQPARARASREVAGVLTVRQRLRERRPRRCAR